jgi:hypothetical protein
LIGFVSGVNGQDLGFQMAGAICIKQDGPSLYNVRENENIIKTNSNFLAKDKIEVGDLLSIAHNSPAIFF